MMIHTFVFAATIILTLVGFFAIARKIEKNRDIKDLNSKNEIWLDKTRFDSFIMEIDEKDVKDIMHPINTTKKRVILRCIEKFYGVFSIILIMSELRRNNFLVSNIIKTLRKKLKTFTRESFQDPKRFEKHSAILNIVDENLEHLKRFFALPYVSNYEALLIQFKVPYSIINNYWIVLKQKDFVNFSFSPIKTLCDYEELMDKVLYEVKTLFSENGLFLRKAFEDPNKVSFGNLKPSVISLKRLINVSEQEFEHLLERICFALFCENFKIIIEEFIDGIQKLK